MLCRRDKYFYKVDPLSNHLFLYFIIIHDKTKSPSKTTNKIFCKNFNNNNCVLSLVDYNP